ncbi:MAG TPA: CDP-diacylglycerol--serine O-phosphatidyltransferase [Gemmatimonadaceae bacterium]|jgi:CDP-diacylglycerol--serine O-phosphatidyltransferase|nr:CDP-diacylglycerol--serine O-phosphatidyltransferase [Gemmatimonadaceae bacterium]
MTPRRRPLRRPDMRRAVILFPSGLTLGNLFFGIFAIISASRGQFVEAGVFVLLGGACDALDGQVARATNAGTQFGEELDSLVDAITFGLAPGLIMYFAVLNRDNWDWISVFLFSACAVMRLARFNIEQAGTAKTYFQGLPSPAAGITLASYYWFSQSWLYNYGAIANLPWHVLLRFLMAALAFLMISNIPYPIFPRTGFRSLRAIAATLMLVGSVALLATKRLEFFFPFALCYVAWGPLRWIFSGMFERRQPTIPYDLSEGEEDEDEEEDVFGPIDSQVHASRQSEREMRPPRAPRERGHREPAERHPARSERPARQEASSPAAPKADRDRSDAERAARREKREQQREKRERREKRRESESRATEARDAAPAAAPLVSTEPPESGVGAITVGESPTSGPVLSVVRSQADGASADERTDAAVAEGAPTKKRKRRRRRGQRDRGGVESAEGSESAEGGESGGRDDEPGDDVAMDSAASDAEPAPAAPQPAPPSAPPPHSDSSS